MQILQRRQGQLLGLEFSMFFLKITRDFDAFISAGIRPHILASSASV